jgi:hypothetical protein
MKAGGKQWLQEAVDWQDAEVLMQLLRECADDLISRGLEIECELYRERFAGLKDGQGRDAIVRNGFLPCRTYSTAIGPVAVRLPKIRSRRSGQAAFRSMLVPRYARSAGAAEGDLITQFLDHLAAGHAARALGLLLGLSIAGIPLRIVRELDACWSSRHVMLRGRNFERAAAGRLWVHGTAGGGAPAHTLAIAAFDGDRQQYQLVALERIEHDSHERWLSVLADLRRRGLGQPLRLTVHFGATAFWGALRNVYPRALLACAAVQSNVPALAQTRTEITV